jgi:hypothetical protein
MGYEAIDLDVETGTENSNAVDSKIHTVSPKGEGSSAVAFQGGFDGSGHELNYL